MGVLVHPGSELIREPRLLVPGMQPLGPVRVDWTHPLAKGLQFFVMGDGTDLCTGNRPSAITGTPLQGRGRLYATNENIVLPHREQYNMLGPITLLAIFNSSRDDGVLYDALVSKGDMPDINTPFEFRATHTTTDGWLRCPLLIRANASGANIRSTAAYTPAWNANTVNRITVSASDITLDDMFLAVNGVSQTLGARFGSQTGNPTANTGSLRIAQRGDGVTDFNGVIYLVAGWSRVIPAQQQLDLQRDPYQFLIPA